MDFLIHKMDIQNPDKNLVTFIEKVLSNGQSLTSKDILKAARGLQEYNKDYTYVKKDINRTLYQLSTSGEVIKINGVPPTWKLTKASNVIVNLDESNEKAVTYVLLDLSNSQCLKEVIPYANSKLVVWAIAPFNYNNYKPNEADLNNPFVHFYELKEDEMIPSATQTRFCMFMSQAINDKQTKSKNFDPKRMTFIVVSKDKSIHTAAILHKQIFNTNYEIVVNSWEGLALYVE